VADPGSIDFGSVNPGSIDLGSVDPESVDPGAEDSEFKKILHALGIACQKNKCR